MKPDTSHDVLIVIPTVADPAVLGPTVERIARHTDGLRVALVLSVNPPNQAAAEAAVLAAEAVCREAHVDLLVHWETGPIGFGAALNRGIAAAVRTWGGVPELTICHNDDAHVVAGWLPRMLAALRTDVVHGYSQPWDPHGAMRPDKPVAGYGRIGVVGPVSNLVAGIQLVQGVPLRDGSVVEWTGDVDAFAATVATRYDGQRITADFLSGFCVGLGRDALDALLMIRSGGVSYRLEDYRALPDTPTEAMIAWTASPARRSDWVTHGPSSASGDGLLGPWDEDAYPIAGYEDNDLCVRAELAGWRCIVAADVFVGHIGHQTFDRLFPEALRGLRNRAAYYRRWQDYTSPARDLVLGAVYRIRFETGYDLVMARASIGRAAQLCDRIAIVLNGHPLEVRDDLRWEIEQRSLQPADVEMLKACSGQDPAGVATAVARWVRGIAAAEPRSRMADLAADDDRVVVEVWLGEFDERAERNRSHALGEAQGTDWLLSIDHDEVVEDRITRAHLERCMRHPDPLVRSWDQSWLNHWDSSRNVREDRPWGDGGNYHGGMHGFRLWRLPRDPATSTIVSPRRIFAGTVNGLHCGNSPDHDLVAKRVSGIRFRHFGYVRSVDRQRKHARYHVQDVAPDAKLTGNKGRDAYGHLIDEEGMRMSPYVAINGIGLHVLLHAGEATADVARVLDTWYGLVDRIVFVWTGPWDEADRRWLAPVSTVAAARMEALDRLRLQCESMGVPNPSGDPVIAVPGVALPDDWPATGPSREVAELGMLFGVEWVAHELRDDLGAARNTGVRALLGTPGMGWSLFCDLDEHFPDPFACLVAVRRMAEISNAWGWVWRFRNHHGPDVPASQSESTRMARLLPGVELTGRVHETFDAAFDAIQATGRDVVLRETPFVVEHFGLARDHEAMDRKLRRYQRMLLLELADRPRNSAAWVSLGLQLLNDGDGDLGLRCLENAVSCGDTGYLAFRELGVYHLRIGIAMIGEALSRVGPGHEWHRALRPLWEQLRQAIPPLTVLGSAQVGGRSCDRLPELPAFTPAAEVRLLGPPTSRRSR